MSEAIANRLKNFEAAPPPHAWEALSEALQDQGSAGAKKLYHFEQPPAPGLWPALRTRLDTPVAMPRRRRWLAPGRVAAAVVAAAVLTAVLLTRSDDPERALRNEPAFSATPFEAQGPNGPSERLNPSRYLTVATQEGKAVRLSKKVYPVFNCAEDSHSAQHEDCLENIELLRHKMASATASPSGDFAALMDMIKTLEETP